MPRVKHVRASQPDEMPERPGCERSSPRAGRDADASGIEFAYLVPHTRDSLGPLPDRASRLSLSGHLRGVRRRNAHPTNRPCPCGFGHVGGCRRRGGTAAGQSRELEVEAASPGTCRKLQTANPILRSLRLLPSSARAVELAFTGLGKLHPAGARKLGTGSIAPLRLRGLDLRAMARPIVPAPPRSGLDSRLKKIRANYGRWGRSAASALTSPLSRH
jgi:hypothetical protein